MQGPTQPASSAQAFHPPRTNAPHEAPASTPEARIEAVYDRAAPALYRFFLVRLSNDSHTASDLMQQLWLAAVRNARAVPEHELEFWLRSVARRLLASHWRTHTRALRFRADAAAGSARTTAASSLADQLTTRLLPPSVLESDETRTLILLALTDLPADDQHLIIEHYFRGVPHAQIAEREGSTPRAIEGRLYRARQALRKRLTNLASLD
ncbi:MAG: sigma-70 family RNA polymerase sigma factor [Phycisphaeraceae bacterium]|nr:sigma-70 family RNA polymerase sigma factor [Phycisphaeraceae bacterium]